MSKRIVIIGGGIAGLCAGVYAQACGYQVDVIERHSEAGGLATSWQRGGYTFENCLQWLVGSRPGGELHALWQEVFDIDRLTFVNHDEFTRLEKENGETLRIYADVDRLEAELLAKAPQDREPILELTQAIRRCTDMALPDFDLPWPQLALAFLRLAPRLPMLQHWTGMSGDDYAQGFKHDLLRRFFSDGAMGRMSAVAVLFTLAWQNDRNAGYALGGSRAIIDAIAARFGALGGHLRLGKAAVEILVEDDTAIGVRLDDGSTITADWVISAADGHATIHQLLKGRYRDRALDERYEQTPTFPSYLQVSLGVACALPGEPGLISLVLDAPLQLDPQTTLDTLSIRIFNFDPSFAPPGKTAITCFLPTENHAYWIELRRDEPGRYAAEKARVAEAVLAILERRLPEIIGHIEVTDVATPASVVRFTGNWKGSMEGWIMTPSNVLAPLHQQLPGLRRFLMAGQWVRPGGGLPSGLMTGRAAVQAICREDGIAFRPPGMVAGPDGTMAGSRVAK
jgi:phytoene dehydrogenase-like protein